MKRAITLQNQHFLKKNYTYNFFRSSIRFNVFFLKNNIFLFKFYKILKFFFFTNFFFQKKIIFNIFNLTPLKQKNSLFLKKKKFLSKYNNLYGQNYIVLSNELSVGTLKQNKIELDVTKINIINYNYNNIFNFNQFFNILIINNIK
jgi:hypothetical protein